MSSFDYCVRRTHAVLAVLSVVAMSACGGDKATGPAGGGGTTEQWVGVSTRSWTSSARTEQYECHAQLATADQYYTGFRLANPSAAQTEVYLLARPTTAHTGDFDCDLSAVSGGELIYAAGAGTTPITFSAGKGVHVAAGQYVVLVVHINNTSASPVTASTTVEARVAAAKDVTTPIDMTFAGKLNFAIYFGGDTTPINGACDVGDDLHIVAAIPIMHSLAFHQTFVFIDPSATAHTIADVQFDPQHIVYTPFAPDLLVPAMSQLHTTCKYVNNTGFVVNFGESATDELCFAGFYRYPPKPPTDNSPYECARGGTI